MLEEKLGMIDYRYDAEKNQFEIVERICKIWIVCRKCDWRKKTGIYEFISYDEILGTVIYFNSLE